MNDLDHRARGRAAPGRILASAAIAALAVRTALAAPAAVVTLAARTALVALAAPAALALAILAAPMPAAHAQTAGAAQTERAQNAAARARERFAAADLDHDGKLTREEADGKMPYVHQHFDEMDQGRKGYVTLDDLQAYTRQAMARRRGGTTAAQ